MEKIIDDESILIRTIIWEDDIAGHVLSFILDGEREVSYWIGKDYWGKGIATEAVRLAEAYGFEKLGLTRITIVMDTKNTGSEKVAIKAGYKKA